MSSVGLLFVGAALFVNGLLFLGQVDAKTAGVFNLFVGALQTAIPFYLIATASNPDQILAAAGVFMFGFTYLYVGINNLAGYEGNGLGWYSAWVSLMSLIQLWCFSRGSTLTAMTLTFRFSNSALIFATVPNSVVHTGVKSAGCENKTPHELPSQPWKSIVPSVVVAEKLGERSPNRNAICLLWLFYDLP